MNPVHPKARGVLRLFLKCAPRVIFNSYMPTPGNNKSGGSSLSCQTGNAVGCLCVMAIIELMKMRIFYLDLENVM